jgi:hypothetical protein
MGLKILVVILFIFIILNRERHDCLIRKIGKKIHISRQNKERFGSKNSQKILLPKIKLHWAPGGWLCK